MKAVVRAETSSSPERSRPPVKERAATPWLGAPGAPAGLRVSRPGDPSEREAERIAETVASDAARPERVQARFENVIARKSCSGCAGGTPCASCAGADHEHEEEGVLAQRAPAAHVPAHEGPSTVPRWLGGGVSLPSGLQSFFGRRLGADVGPVRIHTGPAPAAAARALSARAFTVGRDVVFGEGEYQPESAEGRKLIAHELVHTLQQSRGEIRRTITVNGAGNTPLGHTQTWGATVVGLFNQLCPGITWSLDAQGRLRPANADDCTPAGIAATTTPRSCGCVCSFLTAGGPHATISHSPTENQTTVGSGPNSFDILLTGREATSITGVLRNTDPPAGGSSRQALTDPPWIILGHELCGHAGGTIPANRTTTHGETDHEMNRDWSTSAVDIENQIRAEHTAAGGTDLGIRMGDFVDPDGHLHFGSRIVMPRSMQLISLLRELNVPIGHFSPRCTVNNDGAELVYTDCSGVPQTGLGAVRMLERVLSLEDWVRHLPYRCLWKTFPAGFHLAIEGIFWHRTIAGETKATIADRWGVTVQWLNRANLLFDPAVAALPDTDQLPAGTTLVIPYKWAPGTQRYFLERHTPTPGEEC